jgi:hypothetical protein
MTDVHKVTVQVGAPRGTFPNRVEIGYYGVAEILRLPRCLLPCSSLRKRQVELHPSGSHPHLFKFAVLS